MDIAINYVGVLVASIAAYAVGALWYTVLFGKQWRKLMGVNPESMKNAKLTPAQSMGIGFIVVVLMTYVLAHFLILVGITDLTGALALGFWVWVGFEAPMLMNSFLYENRPISLFLINASQQLVASLVAAAVLFWM